MSTIEFPVIDIPQIDLPPLPPGLVIPSTVGDLLEQAGFEKIYVGLIGEKDELVKKVISPLSRMPRKGKDPFEFTVKFEGPFAAVVYAVLMEGERRSPDWIFRLSFTVNGIGRKFIEGETYIVTLRQEVR